MVLLFCCSSAPFSCLCTSSRCCGNTSQSSWPPGCSRSSSESGQSNHSFECSGGPEYTVQCAVVSSPCFFFSHFLHLFHFDIVRCSFLFCVSFLTLFLTVVLLLASPCFSTLIPFLMLRHLRFKAATRTLAYSISIFCSVTRSSFANFSLLMRSLIPKPESSPL